MTNNTDIRQSALNKLISSCEQLDLLLKTPSLEFTTGELAGIVDVWKLSIKLTSEFATKLTLTFKESDDPSDGIPYAIKMEQAINMIVQGSRHIIIELEAGTYLSNLINNRTRSLIVSIKNLAEALRDYNYNHNKVPMLTKAVWDYCKALENCPLDEKVAIRNDIKEFIITLKDALGELQELKKKNEGNDKDNGDDGEDEDEDGEEDGEDDVLSEDEMVVLPGVIQLVKYGVMFAERLEKIIELSNNEGSNKTYITWLNELRLSIHSLGEAIDNLSEGVYPPQNTKEELNNSFQVIKDIIMKTIVLLRTNSICIQENIKNMLVLIEQKVNGAQLII